MKPPCRFRPTGGGDFGMPIVSTGHINYQIKSQVSTLNDIFKVVVNNPNTWDTTNWTMESLDSARKFVNPDDENQYLYVPNTSATLAGMKSFLSTTHSSNISISVATPNNYVEIGGISGLLTGIRIWYWGDYATPTTGVSGDEHVARTIQLYADDNTDVYSTGTRTCARQTVYALDNSLYITNKLRIEFYDLCDTTDTQRYLPCTTLFTFAE